MAASEGAGDSPFDMVADVLKVRQAEGCKKWHGLSHCCMAAGHIITAACPVTPTLPRLPTCPGAQRFGPPVGSSKYDPVYSLLKEAKLLEVGWLPGGCAACGHGALKHVCKCLVCCARRRSCCRQAGCLCAVTAERCWWPC